MNIAGKNTFQVYTNRGQDGHTCPSRNYPVGQCKENKLDAQLILSIFRQPLHVSGVSRLIIRRYKCMYKTTGIYCSF
jgi:hypothetical protein